MPDSFDYEDFSKRFQNARHSREKTTGPLSDLAKHIRAVFTSRALAVHLWIRPVVDEDFSVTCWKMILPEVRASLNVKQGSNKERAVLDFLSSRGLDLPKDTPLPESFLPDLPVYLIPDITPLPQKPESAAELISSLFKHVGVGDDAIMSYEFLIKSDANPRP